MLCVSIGAWAYGGVNGAAFEYDGTNWTQSTSLNGSLVFHSTPVAPKQQYFESTTAGLLSQWITDKSNQLQYFDTSGYNLVKLSGKFNSDDLLALFKTSFFSGYPCVDLSDVEIEGDIDWSEVASALDSGETPVAQTIVLPTSPAPEAATKGVFFNKFQCVAYFGESEKRNLEVYCLNDKVSTLLPVVSENMSIRYSQYYNNDGTQPTDGRLYPSVLHTAMDGLKSLPVAEVDFTWANVSDLKDGDGNWHFDLNANTHYLVIPQSVSQYKVADDFTNESESNYRYGDNIWVVSTYKGTDSPYATGAVFGGQYLATNSDGINETANITYIRKNGALAGATPYLTDYAKNAARMIVVSKDGAGSLTEAEGYVSDLTSMANSHSVSVDLTQYIVPDGEDISLYGNEYVNHIALPDNTPLATMETILANCSCPTAIGVYDTDDHHLYTHSQAPNQLTKVVEMIESAKGSSGPAGDVTKITMKGLLTGADFACSSTKYNIASDGTIDPYNAQGSNASALWGAPVTYADFSEAAFVPQTQFAPALLGYANTLEEIHLPSQEISDCSNNTYKQTILPESSFDNCKNLEEICIPGTYEEIGKYAFRNCGALTHVYTTGVDAETKFQDDMGANTATLPPSLKKIGTGAFFNVFKFTDVYVTTPNDQDAPECEQDAFDAGTYWGNNTVFGGRGWDRVRVYDDNGNIKLALAYLHWPESDGERNKVYTDVTRAYSIPANEGVTDINGDLIYFPSQAEMIRSFLQGEYGYTWEAWPTKRNEYYSQVEGFNYYDIINPFYGTGVSQDQVDAQSDANYTFDKKYAGWHQFVLSANYSYVPRIDLSNYKENDWYTICMPYDLTKSDLLSMFGAKYQEGKVTTVDDEVLQENEVRYPEVVTLTGVKRDKENAKIYLHLSSDLVGANSQWNFDAFYDRDKKTYNSPVIARNHTESDMFVAQEGDDPVIMKAGYPHLIKPYLSEEDLKAANAGDRMVPMTKKPVDVPFKQYKVTATNGPVNKDGEVVDLKDKPFTQDFSYFTNKSWDAAQNGYVDLYSYFFVGTFERVEGGIPTYAYYLGKSTKGGKHKFFRHTSSASKNWSKYSCIILPNPGAMEQAGAPKYEYQFPISAEDDSFIDEKTNDAKITSYEMYFDDSEVTGIRTIEYDNVATGRAEGNGRIFNVNGQYVGTSLKGLAKGIYVVNGRKIIVK